MHNIDRCGQVIRPLTDFACDAIFDYFRNGATTCGYDRSATGEGFNHNNPKWFFPLDWEHQASCSR